MRVRQAAWQDGDVGSGWTDDWVWYAAAIARMKALTPGLDDFRALFVGGLQDGLTPARRADLAAIAQQWSDPLSLGYQSQVHGTFAADRSSWPRHEGTRVLWQECAHDQWFFLPWHRAYLVEFEDVVRRHVTDLGGPAETWALPYWNYSDHLADPRRLGLPVPLRGETLPEGLEVPGVEANHDGSRPNPLFEPTRLALGDLGPGESSSWASAAVALRRPHFANQEDTGSVSLGGGVVEDAGNPAVFHSGQERGQLDAQPHGTTHGHVGGFMWLFETAALDPAFWVHHNNVDRLWETYAGPLGHGYPFAIPSSSPPASPSPAEASWTSQPFRFLQPDGSVREWTSPQLLDTAALGYTYADVSPPELGPEVPAPPGSETGAFGLAPTLPPEPLVAAAGVRLEPETRVVLRGAPASGDRPPLVAGAFDASTRWLLRFTGIRAEQPAQTSFEVRLGGGGGEPLDCGGLSLFGAHEATVGDGSSGSGTMQVLDVTEQVRVAGEEFAIDGAEVVLLASEPGRSLAGVSVDQVTLEFVQS